jgi:hypothetical protein
MDEVKSNTAPATAKANSAVYKISPRHEHRESMITVSANGERINLAGKDLVIKRQPTQDDPRTEIKVRAATQEDLKNHFEGYGKGGHQDVVIKVS